MDWGPGLISFSIMETQRESGEHWCSPFLHPGWSYGQTTTTTMLSSPGGSTLLSTVSQKESSSLYYFLPGIWWKTYSRQVAGFSSSLSSNQERAVFLLTCAHLFLSPFWSGWYAPCYFSLILLPCSHLCSGPYHSSSFLKVFKCNRHSCLDTSFQWPCPLPFLAT